VQRALLRTAQEVAKGLAYVHSLGVVHADLKPANVLLQTHRGLDRRGYTARLADFGVHTWWSLHQSWSKEVVSQRSISVQSCWLHISSTSIIYGTCRNSRRLVRCLAGVVASLVTAVRFDVGLRRMQG